MPFAEILLGGRELWLSMRLAGEAEASSAGEQLAEDYPAGTHRTDGLREGHHGSSRACPDASGR